MRNQKGCASVEVRGESRITLRPFDKLTASKLRNSGRAGVSRLTLTFRV